MADSSLTASGGPIRVLTLLGAASADQQVVTLADSAGNLLGTSGAPFPVINPALTKGTQGANGVSTQDLKDAGRTPVVLSASAIASVTTEAAFTLNIWKPSGVTSATSYTVTTGKTLRIQAVQFGVRFATMSTTVTFGSTTFKLRAGAAGTFSTSTPLVYSDSKVAASNVPTPNSDLTIPDGLEIAGGQMIGVTHLASATTLLEDLLIVGYEY